MAETLSAIFKASLSATLSNPTPFGSAAEQLTFSLAPLLSAAGKMFSASASITAGASTDYNVQTFGGALDNLGQTYSLSVVNLLLIQNLSLTDQINIMPSPAGSGWVYFLPLTSPDSDTPKLILHAGESVVLLSPTGFTVNSGSHVLRLDATTAGANVPYNLVILGA